MLVNMIGNDMGKDMGNAFHLSSQGKLILTLHLVNDGMLHKNDVNNIFKYAILLLWDGNLVTMKHVLACR